MFTGLVADKGTVTAVDATADGVRLAVETALAPEIGEGDSVAVNGVCLTATAIEDGRFSADVMHETLRRSSLGDVAEGARVNLELPLRAADRLGGHFVQGHVDGIGTVWEVRDEGFARAVAIGAPPASPPCCSRAARTWRAPSWTPARSTSCRSSSRPSWSAARARATRSRARAPSGSPRPPTRSGARSSSRSATTC